MTEENNTKSFFLGALLGGIVGGISSLLLAPKSGQQLRKDICSACKQLAQEAEEGIKEAAETGKQKAKHLAEEGKEKLKAGEHAIKKEVKE
jgi:gas vesicle protein